MQHESGSEINQVQTITTEIFPKSQHLHPAKEQYDPIKIDSSVSPKLKTGNKSDITISSDHDIQFEPDSRLLTNTKQLISNITDKLQQQIQKQTELLKAKEKYERDIKELKSKNARLLEKRMQKQLETHERNIEALSSIKSPRGEFIQTESQNTDQSCTPEVKKTVNLKKTIRTLEIEKNKNDSMITALKEQLYSHKEQKQHLLNQISRIKKEVSLNEKLKSDIKKVSNNNKSLKQKIKQVKKKQSSATKMRVKKLKGTMQLTVEKLKLDLQNERKTIIDQQNQINELEKQVQLLLKHSPLSPNPTQTKESPKVITGITNRPIFTRDHNESHINCHKSLNYSKGHCCIPKKKEDDKKRSRCHTRDVSFHPEIPELGGESMGLNKLILANCQKKEADSSTSSPCSWQRNRALGLGLDVKLTTDKQYGFGSTKGKICRSPTISPHSPNKTWQNARAMGLGNVGLFGTLGVLSSSPTIHSQKSAPPSILSSLAPSINSHKKLSSIQNTTRRLNPLLKMLPSGYP